MYSSLDIGVSFLNDKRYDIIGRGLEKILLHLGIKDAKVVCRGCINNDMLEKERFQIIVAKESDDWAEILKEN